MSMQFSTAARNAALDAIEATIGTAPTLEIRSGAPPATPATADSGTLLAEIELPSDWMADASSASKAKSGTWSALASSDGTPGHFRIKQGATCHIQGSCGQQVDLVTNGATAANGNVLNFADTTGVQVGHRVVGSGIPDDTYVLALTGTTVTLSRACPSGVAGSTSVAFCPDMVIDAAAVEESQQFTVTSFTLNAGGA